MGSHTDPTELQPGLTAWTNPGNGFRILKLHYSADPAKRAPEWKQRAMQGMPTRGWLREYELSFEAPLGQAVIPEFGSSHVRPVNPSQARILRGWPHLSSAVTGFEWNTARTLAFGPRDRGERKC